MGDMPGYVDSDYLSRAAQLAQRFKERSYELLQLRPGHAVLDVGCGPGVDTIPMAAQVGEDGYVIGVDIDTDMVAEADARVAEEGLRGRVTHQAAGADALPFADGSSDAVRAERLIQVLPERTVATRAVSEMHRVIKPGGQLVLADADWGSASVDFGDSALERRLLTFFAEQLRPNGYAGRELLRLMHAQGFRSLEKEVTAMVHTDLSLLPFDNWLPTEAVKAGEISEAEAQGWRDELNERIAQGSFHATVNLVLVTGCR